MPSTWTAYSKRKSTCKADEIGVIITPEVEQNFLAICYEESPDISEGTIIVRVRESKVTVDYHPQCWWKTAVGIMALTPYAPAGKGRRKLPISDEEVNERRKLASRYSAFQTRIRNYNIRIMNGDLNSSDLKLSVQIMKLKQDQLWYEMQKLGGAPERWRVPDAEKDKKELPQESDRGTPLYAGGT